ncbi:MAG: AAA family ATPase, partial [Candidatus Cloacimonas sp.]|nr:AAA family ATPase [Candidatus Cloacimonas sp.]
MIDLKLKKVKMKIDKIRIENFRGATNPIEIEFDNRPIALIFGENGTGKSTIIDALDFVCNQKLGSLDNMSVGVKGRSYTSSIGATLESVKVDVHSGSNKWTARFYGRDISVNPQGTCPRASIIRRSEITKLITAQPNERYKELQRFVSVPLVDSNESALEQAFKQKDKEMKDCVVKEVQARDTLHRIYIEEKKGFGDFVTWAETESQKDVSDLEQSGEEIDQITKHYDRLHSDLEQCSKLKIDRQDKEGIVNQAQVNLNNILKATASQSVELLDVLNAANDYIDKAGSITACPVCEQSVKIDELKLSISKRVIAMATL